MKVFVALLLALSALQASCRPQFHHDPADTDREHSFMLMICGLLDYFDLSSFFDKCDEVGTATTYPPYIIYTDDPYWSTHYPEVNTDESYGSTPYPDLYTDDSYWSTHYPEVNTDESYRSTPYPDLYTEDSYASSTPYPALSTFATYPRLQTGESTYMYNTDRPSVVPYPNFQTDSPSYYRGKSGGAPHADVHVISSAKDSDGSGFYRKGSDDSDGSGFYRKGSGDSDGSGFYRKKPAHFPLSIYHAERHGHPKRFRVSGKD